MALANKIAVITGAASGIGLETAKAFLSEGVKKIALFDIKESFDPSSLGDKYPDASHIYVKADVSSEEQVRNAFQETLKKYGNIDIVVNSAGIARDSKWRQEVDVNVNGTIIVTLAGIDAMRKDKNRKGGTIVNLSSETAFHPYPIAPIYTATKMAIVGLSQCFGSDLFVQQTGVKVIGMCPSATRTGMCPASDDLYLLDFDFLKAAEAKIGESIQMQNAESVGKCIVQAIIDGESGSIWYNKNDLPGKKVHMKVE